MSNQVWDGITLPATIKEERNALCQRLANAAKSYDWQAALAILTAHRDLINSSRPGGSSHYTVLHQAAHGGAPVEVVEQLTALGAWRTLRTANGERPIDIAQRRGHEHLIPVLTPIMRHSIASDGLVAIQRHFHAVIHERAANLIHEHQLRLPELEPLLEMEEPRLWFAIPGMYGGFHFRLDRISDDPVLITESWCRVVGGSGQRHIVSPFGYLLVAEGFV